MENNITPNKEWYIELSEKDGILFCAVHDRLTVGNSGIYSLGQNTTDTETLIDADDSDKLMFEAIDILTPDKNIYVNSRKARYKIPGAKYNFLENTFSFLAWKKYEQIVRSEVEKDNIALVSDANYRHTFFLGDKKELIKKYFDYISFGGEFFGDCVVVPKRKKFLPDKELFAVCDLIENRCYSHCADDPEWFRQVKEQLTIHPFILYSYDFSVEMITTLYSKAEAIRRLKKVTKPYGLGLYVGDFLKKS